MVAELFSLAEWQRWRGEHPNAPLGDWLTQQLAVMHPQLPVQVARELVAARLILPVLDGLDEIASVEHRRACVTAIDAYAGRGEPHRPFVLTCRAREYRELAPDWVRDDDCVMLIGLQPDQIRCRLNEFTAGRSAWNELRTRQAAGDTAINELFCSPLRLAIALQVYEGRDPGELIALTSTRRRAQLWELLLQTDAGYRGATGAQTRAWLAWLATSLHRTSRQRFMLHELYLLDPNSPKTFRVFRIIGALAVGLGGGLAVGLPAGLSDGLSGGLVVGLFFGLVVGLAFGMSASPRPSVRTQRSWRERMRHATRVDALVGGLGVGLGVGLAIELVYGLLYGLDGFALVYGLVLGLVFGLIFVVMGAVDAGRHVMAEEPPARPAHAGPGAGLIASRSSGLVRPLVRGLGVGLVSGLVFALSDGIAIGLLTGLVLGLIFVVMGAVSAGRHVMAEEPPARPAHAGPGAGLVASRSSGLVGGLVFGLVGGLVAGLVSDLAGGLVVGLVFGLVAGLAVGLVGGLTGGLDAWLYHHWLRWRLSARGVLPTQLPGFLEWCAQDERGWLRISDAYEFRHRELLEHLAPTTSAD